MSTLLDQHCRNDAAALGDAEAAQLLSTLEGWQRQDLTIHKTYRFADYYRTIAFVNAIAWLSHREDHHPDLVVRYNSCRVTYTTHAAQWLTLNDFICAAKADALLA